MRVVAELVSAVGVVADLVSVVGVVAEVVSVEADSAVEASAERSSAGEDSVVAAEELYVEDGFAVENRSEVAACGEASAEGEDGSVEDASEMEDSELDRLAGGGLADCDSGWVSTGDVLEGPASFEESQVEAAESAGVA